MKFLGFTARASSADPAYEIRSDATDHIAMLKGSALRPLPK
jgi:hypothetical protein